MRSVEEVLRQLVEAQDKLLVAHRLGDSRRAGPAIDRVQKLRATLAKLDRAASGPGGERVGGEQVPNDGGNGVD